MLRLQRLHLKRLGDMKNRSVNNISSELLAAFLDGNATAQECQQILDAVAVDDSLRELLEISQSVDSELMLVSRECEVIPMAAMAASCGESCLCSLECEKYILNRYGIQFDEQEMLQNAIQNGWQKQCGTALHNVGRHLESQGLVLTREYKATIEDIAKALNDNKGVIVAVDGGELLGDRTAERVEDILVGPQPDHIVVVLGYDAENQIVTIYDPNSPNLEDSYPLAQFTDAWNDSKNYLITIYQNDMKNTYTPKPIDLSDVELSEDLNELLEAIAENAHDVWALQRQAQGWTYGPHRDDALKQTPCMVPYSQLPESEKDYDRDMAIETLKLVRKLGYDLIKREDTELYRVLLSRIRNSNVEFLCPHCLAKGIKTPIFRHDIFCSHCGLTLDVDWSMYEK